LLAGRHVPEAHDEIIAPCSQAPAVGAERPRLWTSLREAEQSADLPTGLDVPELDVRIIFFSRGQEPAVGADGPQLRTWSRAAAQRVGARAPVHASQILAVPSAQAEARIRPLGAERHAVDTAPRDPAAQGQELLARLPFLPRAWRSQMADGPVNRRP